MDSFNLNLLAANHSLSNLRNEIVDSSLNDMQYPNAQNRP